MSESCTVFCEFKCRLPCSCLLSRYLDCYWHFLTEGCSHCDRYWADSSPRESMNLNDSPLQPANFLDDFGPVVTSCGLSQEVLVGRILSGRATGVQVQVYSY